MLKDRLTLVIHTCDKFSDLWDSHIQLLDRNWADRGVKTLLVTDKQTERTYQTVEILPTGDDFQLSKRIQTMLPYIQTEYVLVTLDDYFPIYPIDSGKIQSLIDAMDKEELDYIRLFKRPDAKKRIPGYQSLYAIDLQGKMDVHYQVNFYAGIWRKSFIEKTVEKELDPWQYELSLTKIARRDNLRCAMSKGKEFEVLDVVRKGKLLHKANRYLKKHDLYHGPREVISWTAEFKINGMTFVKDHFPQSVVDIGKTILRKMGYRFYSDQNRG